MKRRNRDSRWLKSTLGAALVGSVLAVLPGDAAGVSGGVGIDYTGGPGNQATKDALGYVSTAVGHGELILIGARYDNTEIGAGSLGSIAAGVPVVGSTQLRVVGARTIGDGTYRAWRVQTGPQFDVGGGRTLGVFYLHVEDNLTSLSNGITTELGIPLAPALVVGLGASFASIDGRQTGGQGSANLTWTPTPRVQLLGEMSVGQNLVVGSSQGGSSSQGGILGQIPIHGIGSKESQPGVTKVEYPAQATALVGLRFLFP